LNVFALQRRDESLRQFFGQLLGNSFVFAPALSERRQVGGRAFVVDLRQQVNQVMNAGIRLLRTRFQQVVEPLVVSEEFSNREHKLPTPPPALNSAGRGRQP
jgi:hypothetical protein